MPINFAGARWWKFDFHTHTPSSTDTPWHKAIGTPDEVTPEKWLRTFMDAGIDCVAVTDHNGGEWIDRLKTAYSEMKDNFEEGFRELTIFAGVELTVHDGVHLLAVFGPEKSTSDIDSLLGAVGYRGDKGSPEVPADKSLTEAIQEITKRGGIPIPAHVDQDNGLFKLKGQSQKHALETREVIAMELVDPAASIPDLVRQLKPHWARVIGSDCHSFQGDNKPGSRFTWVKMGAPSLEGLRLALLDGDGSSIRRSDEVAVGDDPNSPPEDWIESIQVHHARYMGRSEPTIVEFSPWLTTLIGGRGTGKSSIVHFLRAGLARDKELDDLDRSKNDFERFLKPPKNVRSNEEGALLAETQVQIDYVHAGKRFRITWKPDGSRFVQEEEGDQFRASQSQEVPNRFPLRLFSQGQIVELSRNPRALLDIIDQSLTMPFQQQLDEATRRIQTFACQRARVRCPTRKQSDPSGPVGRCRAKAAADRTNAACCCPQGTPKACKTSPRSRLTTSGR